MARSVYSMGARDFRSAINARLIGLCAHCLVHSGGSKCERCGRMLVDAAGEPMTTVRKSPYIEETKPIPVQLHRPTVPGPYQDGTNPACTALRHPEACPHYYVDRINGHCRLARTASFHPSKCRAMLEHAAKLNS